MPETGLVEDTLVCSSEHFTQSKLGSGLVEKFRFSEYAGAAKGYFVGSVCGIVVCWQSVDTLLRDRGVFMLHEDSQKFVALFCK